MPSNTQNRSCLAPGNVTERRKITIWVDLAINVLSTLLLAASNNCAQILSSPTRAEIGSAHSRKKWLDIGVPSVRNLATIPLWRTCLWILLFTSSIPLHFVYNSAIFSSRQAREYHAFAVTEDFHNVDIGRTSSWISQSFLQTASIAFVKGKAKLTSTNPAGVMQRNFSSLVNMTNAECLRNYAQDRSRSNWHNLLVSVGRL
ncbi:hypothetical protein BST61_g10370 [Cercospora zeina]